MCESDSITIKDPVTGSVQCQDCLKCPAGEGLSVECGDVITSKTPLVCEPCVLGETYSAGFEAGACRDCENCGEHRETITACTLKSKAVCGKCKLGAYPEAMLAGMCKPCSPCCNDGKDIIVSDCQVPGVPSNMQCSFARSEKCSKVSTASPTIPTIIATTEPYSVPPELVPTLPTATKGTIPADLEPAGKQVVNPTNGPSSNLNWAAITPAIASGVIIFAVLILVLVFLGIRYFRAKRKRDYTDDDDIELGRVQRQDEANESDGSETDEPKPEDALLENIQEVPVGVEETLNSPLPTGTEETQLPGSHRAAGKPLIKLQYFSFIDRTNRE